MQFENLKMETRNNITTKKTKEATGAFNALYKIGTELIVVDDYGIAHVRKLESKAWIVGDNQIVAKFSGITGGYDIKRVLHKMTYKSNDFGMTYLVPCDAKGVAV